MLNIDNDTAKTCDSDHNVIIFAATVPNLFPVSSAIGSFYFIEFPFSFAFNSKNIQ